MIQKKSAVVLSVLILTACQTELTLVEKQQQAIREQQQKLRAELIYDTAREYQKAAGQSYQMKALSKKHACMLYAEAASLGHDKAQKELGFCYFGGKSVEKNLEQSQYWLRQSAAQDNVDAIFMLGLLAREAQPTKAKEACQWFEKSALLGYQSGQLETASCYRKGIMGVVDTQQTRKWWLAAAEQDHPESFYNLGLSYLGLFKDEFDGLKGCGYMQKAGEMGYKKANFIVAQCYSEDELLGYDYNAAKAWLEKVDASDKDKAAQLLKELDQKKMQHAQKI